MLICFDEQVVARSKGYPILRQIIKIYNWLINQVHFRVYILKMGAYIKHTEGITLKDSCL